MKQLYVSLSLLLFCSYSDGKTIKLSAKIAGLQTGSTVYLSKQEATGILDSIAVTNSSFQFIIDVQKHGVYFLKFTNAIGEMSFSVYLDQHDLSLEVGHNFQSVLFTGSAIASEQTDFFKGYYRIFRDADAVMKNLENDPDSICLALKDSLNKKTALIAEEYSSAWIRNHPDSEFSLAILYLEMQNSAPALLNSLFETISNRSKLDSYVTEIIPQMILDSRFKREFKTGDKIRDFVLSDTAGMAMRFSELSKNKIIVLDFWASWCAPCRLNSPALGRLATKYGKDKLLLVGISADDNREKWVKAIRDDNMDWIHLSDLKGTAGGFTEDRSVFAFPTYIVIDREGTIIARPATVIRLGELLETKFAN